MNVPFRSDSVFNSLITKKNPAGCEDRDKSTQSMGASSPLIHIFENFRIKISWNSFIFGI